MRVGGVIPSEGGRSDPSESDPSDGGKSDPSEECSR